MLASGPFAPGAAVVKGVFDFHCMQESCQSDQPEGWRRFVESYAPLAQRLLEHYFPGHDTAALLVEVFRQARANQAELWRTFSGVSEKEFLLHFHRFVLQQGRAARGAWPETPLSPQNFQALLEEFPPLQREMLALSFRGYEAEELSQMMKFHPETIRTATERAQEKLRARLGEAIGPDFSRRDHDALFAAIEAQRGENCVPDKIFPRIVDGQTTWREREEAERHIESCLHCLNRFADYYEVFHYHRTLPPADGSTVARLAAALGLPAAESGRKSRKSWWRRLRGR